MIAAGVSEGLFGYVGKDTGGNYIGLRFKRHTSKDEIEISETVMLLPKDTAEALASGVQPTEYSKSQPELIVGRESLKPDDDWLKTEPPSPIGNLRGLIWEGEIPWNKWTQFYSKVLARFTTGGGLKLTLKFEVQPEDGVSSQKKAETETALKDLGLKDTVRPVE
jgi:hypothetical protein